MEYSTLVSTLHLLPDWRKRLIEDSKYEASQSQVKLLEDAGRSAVWNMCVWFNCETNGIPGQACRLLERYLYILLRNHDNLFDDADNREDFMQTLRSQIPLMMASCVQLAAKMYKAGSHVNASTIRVTLLCKGISYSIEDIVANEFKVYSMLDFRVPLWTSVEAGELLATEIGLPSKMLHAVAATIDVAEFRRDRINTKVRWAANVSPSSSAVGGVLTLHLTAGAVSATARFLEHGGTEPASRLAHLIHVPVSYIKCIQDAVLAEILAAKPTAKKQPSKRKRL